MNTMCSVRGLYFSYGSQPVLADASFAVGPGEMVAIVGPNGSGKTSLLRILAGLETPQQGTIHFFGHDMRNLTAKKRAQRVAYVPQLIHDDIPFSVRQLVRLGRAPWQNCLGMATSNDDFFVEEAMRSVNVQHLAGRPLRDLSGGERQRVAIARAVCQQPELFLLDEPTAALDYGHQIQIMDMLGRLQREQAVSIIIVSHDLNLAAMYANRLILIRNGHIVAYGSPDQVLTQEHVNSVYGCHMLVDINPCTKSPRVSPLPTTTLR